MTEAIKEEESLAIKSHELNPAEPKQLSPLEMMQQVLQTQNPRDAVEVVKELAKLQMDMRKQDAEIEFNHSLAACTAELKLVINDSVKTAPGGKQWATYRALDKEVRPAMMRHGLGLSWSTTESPIPEQMIMQAHVSKGLHTRVYSLPMDIGGKGPQGAGALSKPHAIGAGVEYGRRYLLKMIFNLITGDEGDQGVVLTDELTAAIEKIMDAGDKEVVTHYYKEAYRQFESDPNAIKVILEAKHKRMKQIGAK